MIRRTRAPLALVAGLGLMLAAACGGGDSGFSNSTGGNASGGGATTGVKLTMLIGSSGDAETKAVDDATAAWAKKGGNTVTVTPAKDLTQELTQALAGGTPPDLFYVDASKFAGLVKANALAAYGDQMPNKDDFYPNLLQSFTSDGKVYEVTGGLAANKNEKLTAHMLHTVEITGDVTEKGGKLSIAADTLKMSK